MHIQSHALAAEAQTRAAHYQEGEPNRCPDCGGGHWLVGRIMAQCAHCDAALPLSGAYHRQSIYRFS